MVSEAQGSKGQQNKIGWVEIPLGSPDDDEAKAYVSSLCLDYP